MKTEDVFPKKWLAGDDLPRDTGATIQRVALEELRNPKTHKPERKPVAYFVGKRKALILNRTNWMTLAGLYGNESNEWNGRRVILGSDEVDSPQGRVLAVRIRPVNPDTLPKPPAEDVESEDEDGE
jgi:hypothetical protein